MKIEIFWPQHHLFDGSPLLTSNVSAHSLSIISHDLNPYQCQLEDFVFPLNTGKVPRGPELFLAASVHSNDKKRKEIKSLHVYKILEVWGPFGHRLLAGGRW